MRLVYKWNPEFLSSSPKGPKVNDHGIKEYSPT